MTPHPNRLPGENVNPISSIPFVLVHVLPILTIFTGFGWHDWQILLWTYWVRMFFITAGYHRYFAHRAFRTNRVFQFILAFGGLTATQKGPLWWAGHHRLHHRYTDTVQDAHSPIKGVLFSHVGWILATRSDATPTESIADFNKFPELRFLNRNDWLGPWALAVACYFWGGWSGLLVGYFLSTVMLWHGTFLVNSMSHLMGSRRYATADSSRNNAFVAFFTLGEGWHNNHHHIQSSARQGFKWWEFDVTFYVLKLLSYLHIVTDLRKPNAKMLRTALISEGAYDIGMFEFHWDKATTRVAAATQRQDLADVRVEFAERADEALVAARELGRRSRRPFVDLSTGADGAIDPDDGLESVSAGAAADDVAPSVEHPSAD